MLSSSATTQKYSRMLDSLDDAIANLQTERASVQVLMQASKMSDILEQDAAWLRAIEESPRDWEHLLKTTTSSQEWMANVALEGVGGRSEWTYSDQRAITLEFYTEVPERCVLFARLLECIVPFLRPWHGSSALTDGGCYVAAKSRGCNLLLGVNAAGAWVLAGPGGRNEKQFTDAKSALKEAQASTARSYFDPEK